MAKVLSRLDILLHANTANYVREMKKATDKTKKELKSVADYGKLVGGQLGVAFATLGSAASISHIVQTADNMQSLASKVRLATSSLDEYKAVQEQLRTISNAQKSSFEGVVDLYSSSHRALSQLGKSQQDVINFTKNMTMAMNIGGGSAQAQSAALVQLGQALGSGALRGDEFNSVAEQAPILLDLVAKEMGVATGALRGLAAEGAITSDVVYNAVVQATDSLTAMSAKMPTTFSQGVQVIKNEYNYLIDDIMNQNSMLSQNLANTALWTAENFRTLVGVGATLGAVWLANVARNSVLVTSFVGLTSATLANTKASIANAFSVQGQINAYNVLSTRLMLLRLTKAHYLDITKTAIATTTAYARSLVGLATSFNTATASARLHTLALAGVTTAKRGAMGVGILATRAVTGLGGAFMSLGRVIMAHPIIALTAVIGAVIARTEGLSGAVKSLGDAFSVAGVLASDFIGGVVDGLGRAWTATANYLNSFMGGTNKAVSFSQTAFGGFFTGTQKGFVGVLQITARVFDLAGASVVTFTQYAWKNISSLGTAIINAFKGVGNFIASVFESVINNVAGKINFFIDGVNTISGMFGGGTVSRLGQVQIERMAYGSTDFGFGGFTASVAKNNQHYLETQVVNAYDKVQSSAKQANTANLGLAGSMADVASAGEKAGGGAKKVADANKLVGKTADEASKALEELEDNFKSQLAEWERAEWDMSTPFISELSKIEFEITSVSGKFHIASDDMKNDLRKLAREMDTAKANFELFGTHTDAIRQMKLLSSKGSKYLEMVYDLQDTGNALHLAGDEQKKQILTTMANLEVATKAWEIQDKILENQKELIALGAPDGIARELLLIEQERADTLEKYNYLLKDGYAEQFALVEQQANALAEQQKQIVVTKQYNDLVQSLKTEEEKRLDTLQSQLDVLLAHQQVMGANLDIERAKQLISQSVGLATPTNHYDELNAKTQGQYASLDTGLQALLDNERLTEEERIKIKEWGASERLKIEKAHSLAMNALVLSDSENIFSGLASIAKDGLGEQSRLYRAMFAMQQGFAIAQAGLAMQQAISQGLAKGFPTGLADMAMAVSHGAKIVSAIKSVVMPVGQAHDGIMSVPKSGTWNLEKGERVLPRHTAQNLDNTLNRLQNNGGGQVVINQHITINTDGSHDVKDDSQSQMGQALKAGMLAVIQGEMRQGRSIYNFVKNGR
ncbi:tape measure protein [Moraxella bovis]|uniref:tape measure protein n=1 Tax=Moraxella bovis TaxID=476 RepID=UPI0022260B0A|nr:tape measure protein [Moraxella bovis]UZA15845.1 tape measure protein [Moraxella bovis]